jgi:NAD(P)-dependent dehydrogenase (short-subunit alcohol dehydrogenase family)
MPSERTTRTLGEQLARDHGADFREVVLLDDREAAFERFDRRAREDDDPGLLHRPRLAGNHHRPRTQAHDLEQVVVHGPEEDGPATQPDEAVLMAEPPRFQGLRPDRQRPGAPHTQVARDGVGACSAEQGRRVDDPDADTAALDRVHATNYLGVIAIIRAASRVLRADGRIITVSSGFGTRVGVPGVADYSATKSGVERYTMGVARDLGPRGITANVVEAGVMEGGIEAPDPETLKVLLSSLSLQRMGHPREIAAAIAFLASPAASYVTGAVLDAHGGYNA